MMIFILERKLLGYQQVIKKRHKNNQCDIMTIHIILRHSTRISSQFLDKSSIQNLWRSPKNDQWSYWYVFAVLLMIKFVHLLKMTGKDTFDDELNLSFDRFNHYLFNGIQKSNHFDSAPTPEHLCSCKQYAPVHHVCDAVLQTVYMCIAVTKTTFFLPLWILLTHWID